MFNLTQPKIMNIRVSNQLTDREAARILREADRTTRRASTSSERARAGEDGCLRSGCGAGWQSASQARRRCASNPEPSSLWRPL